jgi:DNA-binding MarR family transcriptional regulator
MNVIERLFSSPALYRTLAFFFAYPSEPLNPRLISRYAGVDIKSVVRVVKKLEKMSIVRGWRSGQNRFYLLVREHPAHDGLRSLFAATSGTRKFRFLDPALRIWEREKGW